jgi:hypothetical protein
MNQDQTTYLEFLYSSPEEQKQKLVYIEGDGSYVMLYFNDRPPIHISKNIGCLMNKLDGGYH